MVAGVRPRSWVLVCSFVSHRLMRGCWRVAPRVWPLGTHARPHPPGHLRPSTASLRALLASGNTLHEDPARPPPPSLVLSISRFLALSCLSSMRTRSRHARALSRIPRVSAPCSPDTLSPSPARRPPPAARRPPSLRPPVARHRSLRHWSEGQGSARRVVVSKYAGRSSPGRCSCCAPAHSPVV